MLCVPPGGLLVCAVDVTGSLASLSLVVDALRRYLDDVLYSVSLSLALCVAIFGEWW